MTWGWGRHILPRVADFCVLPDSPPDPAAEAKGSEPPVGQAKDSVTSGGSFLMSLLSGGPHFVLGVSIYGGLAEHHGGELGGTKLLTS